MRHFSTKFLADQVFPVYLLFQGERWRVVRSRSNTEGGICWLITERVNMPEEDLVPRLAHLLREEFSFLQAADEAWERAAKNIINKMLPQ